jgi:broad specificity phosphatase PhoE
MTEPTLTYLRVKGLTVVVVCHGRVSRPSILYRYIKNSDLETTNLREAQAPN